MSGNCSKTANLGRFPEIGFVFHKLGSFFRDWEEVWCFGRRLDEAHTVLRRRWPE